MFQKWLCILFLFSLGFVSSQELPPVRNFSSKVYRAANQNWMITQAENRKLYFANNEGLLEFNGAQWHLYPTPNESIMRSVCSHAGKIYTGAYMDFGYWEPQADGTLSYTSLVEKLKVPIKEDEQFWRIISSESIVLIQSLNSIYSYDPKKDTVQLVLEVNALTKMFKAGNRIFYNVSSEGLYEIVSGKAELIVSASDLAGDVIGMNRTDSQITLVTAFNTLYQLQNKGVATIAENQFPESLMVYSAAALPDGGFALGTISNGLVIIDVFGNIEYQMNQENELSNNTVLSVFLDQDQNLWLGLDNGIDFIDLSSRYKTFIDRTGKLGTIYDAIQYKGSLYLGTNQGLYVKLKGTTNFQFIAGTKGQVWVLKEIQGTLFSGHNLGTFIIDENRAEKISDVEGTWDIQPIPNDSNLLLQGNYNGLNVLQKIDGNWKLRNKMEGFDISSKNFILHEGQIYVSHEYKGLYRLKISSDFQRVESFNVIGEVGKGLNSDLISLNGDLIYAYKSGFYVLAEGNSTFSKNQQLSNLFAGEEYSSGRMIKMDERNFWIFTKNSLVQVTMEPINNSFEFKRYLLPQSKRSEKSGYESLVKVSDQEYLLGTAKGYLLFKANVKEELNSEISIDRVTLSNSLGENQELNFEQSLTLPAGANKLVVSYYTTNFSPFTDIKYQYRLNRISENWSQLISRESLVFENLEYGNYHLEIRPVINGIVGKDIADLDFEIERPYYLSYTAIVLYIIALILFIFLVNLFYRSYYKRKKNQEIRARQKQLELELLQNEKDIAELKNQKLNDDIDARNRELAITTMAMIKKNETLSEISAELNKLKKEDTILDLLSVKKLINKNLKEQQDWKTFEQAFSMTDKAFVQDLKGTHPSLTSGDLRLSIYIRLNLSSKEIAPLLNISPRSVEIKRYRLRKKMKLDKKTDLFDYLVSI